MLLLYVGSARSDLVLSTPPGWDKVLHAGAYGMLAGLAIRAFHGGLGRLARWPTVFAMLLTIGYGMLDEIHQSQVAGRDASILDWIADVVGAGLSVAVLGMLALSRSKRSIREPRTPSHEA